MRIRTLILITLALLANPTTQTEIDTENPDSVIRHVKHQLSSAKLDIKAGRSERARDTVADVVSVLNRWMSTIEKGTNDENNNSNKEKKTYESVVESYYYNQTFKPTKCSNVASEDGDYLKVQYVAWTIPDKTIFSSSFHTGSLPVKIILGGKDEIAGVSLSQGLRGACRGERRNIFIPASHVSSSSPLNHVSDLKFSVEVVEIGRTSSGRKGKRDL